VLRVLSSLGCGDRALVGEAVEHAKGEGGPPEDLEKNQSELCRQASGPNCTQLSQRSRPMRDGGVRLGTARFRPGKRTLTAVDDMVMFARRAVAGSKNRGVRAKLGARQWPSLNPGRRWLEGIVASAGTKI
jgi:hypothetical protein